MIRSIHNYCFSCVLFVGLTGQAAEPITPFNPQPYERLELTNEFNPLSEELHLLVEAIKEGNTEMVKELIDQGVNLNASIHEASTPLIEAVHARNLGMVKLLLENKARVNQKAVNGYTALMVAAEKGYNEIASYLLQKGADAEIRTIDGWNAFRLATTNCRVKIIELLGTHKN